MNCVIENFGRSYKWALFFKVWVHIVVYQQANESKLGLSCFFFLDFVGYIHIVVYLWWLGLFSVSVKLSLNQSLRSFTHHFSLVFPSLAYPIMPESLSWTRYHRLFLYTWKVLFVITYGAWACCVVLWSIVLPCFDNIMLAWIAWPCKCTLLYRASLIWSICIWIPGFLLN